MINYHESGSNLSYEVKREILKGILLKGKQDIFNKDIAIIGVSGRYPLSKNLDRFWENLKNGRNCITEVPSDRWDWRSFSDSDEGVSCKWGGFLDDIDKFDPLFFNISPREAEIMDPQERIFLETAWALLEDAGVTRKTLSKLGHKVGVFVGVMNNNYVRYNGNSAYWSIANRVSYCFDFKGPSIAVDSACSSSLTAIHLACESIKRGECNVAIAGGVNLILHPEHLGNLSKMNMLSKGDRCKAFGEGADGFVDGEGVGAIFLKPLNQAAKDGDTIYAVIKGTSINAGGKTSGYTVPNPNAQAELIKDSIVKSGINPRTISYVEAHGTGTALGDPIEIAGLTKAFSQYTQDKQFCSIGSVKSNIGHLESAAGISGITKILLQMKNKQLVPSINSDKLNPKIDFLNTPFFVQHELADWKQPILWENGEAKRYPRIASVSSFGAGGANSHVILEEYEVPVKNTIDDMNAPRLIVLSARNQERLKKYAMEINNFLEIKTSKAPLIQDKKDMLLLDIQKDLLGMAAEALMVNKEAIDLNENMSEYGFDQINLIELNNKINAKYFMEIAPIILTETGSLFNLAQYIVKNYRDNLDGIINISVDKVTTPETNFSEVNLEELAYTLQIGREEMEERLAIVVSNVQELREKLSNYCHGEMEIPGLWQGNVRRDKDKADLIIGGRAGEEFIRIILNDGNLEKLAQFWVVGVELDWKRLYQDSNPKRISLPTYPFSKQRYWVNDNPKMAEFNQPIEVTPVMANIRLGSSNREQIPVNEIKSRCKQKDEFNSCFSDSQGSIDYSSSNQAIYEGWYNDKEALVYFVIPYHYFKEFHWSTINPVIVELVIDSLLFFNFSTSQGKGSELEYQLGEIKILQPLKERGYIYCRIKEKNQYDITICDSIGSVCIELKDFQIQGDDPLRNFFFIPEWQIVTLSKKEKDLLESMKVKSTDNDQKSILIIYPPKQKGFSNVIGEYHNLDNVVKIQLGNKTLQNSIHNWEINSNDPDAFEVLLSDVKKLDIVYFLGGIQTESFDIEQIDILEKSQNLGVFSLFRFVKALNKYGFNKHKIKFKVLTNNVYRIEEKEDIRPYGGSLTGFTMSLAKEFLNWEICSLDIDLTGIKSECNTEKIKLLVKDIVEEPSHPEGKLVVIRDSKRYMRGYKATYLTPNHQSSFTKGGVYLILGGAGGIGLELSLHLAKTVQAKLVLLGRSILTNQQKEKISLIESMGGQILYLQADATNLESMENALIKAKAYFGSINGVIHSAIVLRDKTIINMNEETFRTAFDSKVKGSVILKKVLQGENLDFIMFFSSVQSFEGNAGQCNYAAGCTFKDAFAEYLSTKESVPIIIVNWGYWGGVGVATGKDYEQRMAMYGVKAINPEEGMDAVERILAHKLHQVIPLKLDNSRLLQLAKDNSTNAIMGSGTYGDKANQALNIVKEVDCEIKSWLKQLFAEVLKLPIDQFDDNTPFKEYGFDSLALVYIVKRIEDRIKCNVDPSTVLSYPTITLLSKFLAENYKQMFISSLTSSNLKNVDIELSQHNIKNLMEKGDSSIKHQSNPLIEALKKIDIRAIYSELNNDTTIDEEDIICDTMEDLGPSLDAIQPYLGLTVLEFILEKNVFVETKPIDKNQIVSKLKLLPKYEYLLEAFLDILKRNNYLGVKGKKFYLTDKVFLPEVKNELNNLQKRMEFLIRAFPELEPHFTLLKGCRKHYSDILSGKIDPNEFLYSDEMLENLLLVYKGKHRLSGTINHFFSQSLTNYITNKTQGLEETFNVLEMGFGTLTTSATLLKTLKSFKSLGDIKYYSTDNSGMLGTLKQELGNLEASVKTCLVNNNFINGIGEKEKFDVVMVNASYIQLKSSKDFFNNIGDLTKEDTLFVFYQPFEAEYLTLTLGLLDEHWVYRRLSFNQEISDEFTEKLFNSLERAGINLREVIKGRLIEGSKSLNNGKEFTILESEVNQNHNRDTVINLIHNHNDSPLNFVNSLLKKRILTTSSKRRIEFFTIGQGEPVVFLTALAFTAPIWKYQIEEFHKQYQLIFPHILPGHAGSNFNGNSFTFEDLADDIVELLDYLGINRAHLIGWCMAGNIGQLFALRHPDRLKSMTLVCTTPTDARFRGLNDQDLKLYSKSPLKTYEIEFFNIYKQNKKTIEPYIDIIRKTFCQVDEEAVVHHIYNVFKFDSSAKLKEIETPTLIFAGKYDVAFPPDQVKLLYQGIENSQYYEFDQGGHLPFLNQNKLFNEILKEFLVSQT